MRPLGLTLGRGNNSAPKPKLVWKRQENGSKQNFTRVRATPVGWTEDDDSRKIEVIEAKLFRLRSGDLT